jgi:hypothetical protein
MALSSINRWGKNGAISGAASGSKTATFSLLRITGTLPSPHRVPTVSPPCPHRVPTVPPPCPHRVPPLGGFELPGWFSECLRHSGRGVMSTSFLSQKQGGVMAPQAQAYCMVTTWSRPDYYLVAGTGRLGHRGRCRAQLRQGGSGGRGCHRSKLASGGRILLKAQLPAQGILHRCGVARVLATVNPEL